MVKKNMAILQQTHFYNIHKTGTREAILEKEGNPDENTESCIIQCHPPLVRSSRFCSTARVVGTVLTQEGPQSQTHRSQKSKSLTISTTLPSLPYPASFSSFSYPSPSPPGNAQWHCLTPGSQEVSDAHSHATQYGPVLHRSSPLFNVCKLYSANH